MSIDEQWQAANAEADRLWREYTEANKRARLLFDAMAKEWIKATAPEEAQKRSA